MGHDKMDKKLPVIVAVAALSIIAAMAAAPTFINSMEFTVTLGSSIEGSVIYTCTIGDGDSFEYTTPFKVPNGQSLTVEVTMVHGYDFDGWMDGDMSVIKEVDSVRSNISWSVSTSFNLVSKIAYVFVDEYTGAFGDNETMKFSIDPSSTRDYITLNGYVYTNSHGESTQYVINIGRSDDPRDTLDALKASSDYVKYHDQKKGVEIIDDAYDSYLSGFTGYYYNYGMHGGATKCYFGFAIEDVYIDGFSTGLTQYRGVNLTFDDITPLFTMVAEACGISFIPSKQCTIGQYIADHYDGSFGPYSVEENLLYSHTEAYPYYGPMSFVICDSADEAREMFEMAATFTYDDVCSYDPTKMSEYGCGEITSAEVPGSTSTVYSASVDKFDGFHGYYASWPTGSIIANPMYFVAYYENVYISSAKGLYSAIDDTESDYQIVLGPDSHITEDDLTALLDAILDGIAAISGGCVDS
jgi:hypothetical protein